MPVVTIWPARKRHAELAHFIGKPGECDPGIAEHVLAMADELFVAQRDDGSLLDEIERTPVRSGRRAQHEQMRAGIIGDDLRRARADEIRKPRIRNLDGGMKRADCVEHLLHRVGLRPRRQVRRHAKGEFRFADTHLVARHRGRAAIRDHRLGQDAPRHRAIDIDVFLSGFAGGGDLPSEQIAGRAMFDRRLDGVTFGAIARA